MEKLSNSFLKKYYKRFLELEPVYKLKNGLVSNSKKSIKKQNELYTKDEIMFRYYIAFCRATNLEIDLKRKKEIKLSILD
jgi:hypothetical protein